MLQFVSEWQCDKGDWFGKTPIFRLQLVAMVTSLLEGSQNANPKILVNISSLASDKQALEVND